MLRWLTSGESHGKSLVGIIEGLPAGIELTTSHIQDALARRRLGYGRGARMKFEQDQVQLLGGVRHGVTMGGPVAIEIANTEWPKWDKVMSADPVDPEEIAGLARNAPLTRPRPGHADFTGMQKYGFTEARPVLERASARETATRVALGTAANQLLASLGITTVAHTVAIGSVSTPEDSPVPSAANVEALDADPLRCFHDETSQAMVAEVDAAHKAGETLGGVVEVVVDGLPPGLGSYVHWDRRLDARLAGALMGIQAIKGVEVGDGFRTAARRGSEAHDEIELNAEGQVIRATNRAGGIESGMSIGGTLRVRAGMKPIATVPKALRTVDVASGESTTAHHQRSDVCAVPAAGVVAEAMVQLILAQAVLEKFGGDSVYEVSRNLRTYLEALPDIGANPEAAGHHGDPLQAPAAMQP
ncbi:chorismate synthase [Nesterenkonia salmonea]|uniref:Chorismate synthase n=1 Tax=Nesterenkonia salmonea TaxID=1804987 RepID=A0A5R9BGR6_9MICC|nr:chorismate synthase [Nesterenkonia salmonea]TLP99110.1 chorismate synthase [Nesterenkonia salmonea]